MSRCSDRGAVEPLAALAAVFAVAVALALYAGVLDRSITAAADERDIASPIADRVLERLTVAGVAHPERRHRALEAVPDRYHARIRVATEHYDWQVGAEAPADASVSRRRVGVRVGPSDVRPGRVTVVVWR